CAVQQQSPGPAPLPWGSGGAPWPPQSRGASPPESCRGRSLLQFLREGDELFELVLRRAALDHLARLLDAGLVAVGAAGDVNGGARVECDDVVRRSRLALEH